MKRFQMGLVCKRQTNISSKLLIHQTILSPKPQLSHHDFDHHQTLKSCHTLLNCRTLKGSCRSKESCTFHKDPISFSRGSLHANSILRHMMPIIYIQTHKIWSLGSIPSSFSFVDRKTRIPIQKWVRIKSETNSDGKKPHQQFESPQRQTRNIITLTPKFH
jgi:hypothetical protein